jgi:outer membrane protein assembly factor BamA
VQGGFVRWLIATGVAVCVFLGGGLCAERTSAGANRDEEAAALARSAPIISEIAYIGLRHVSPATVQALISSRTGLPLDARQIESDVKVLGRLGWFDDVRVESQSVRDALIQDQQVARVRLVFYLAERLYLAKIAYSGSRLLSSAQIEKLLADKHLAPPLGEPADEFHLQRVARTIQSALAELGHPESRIEIRRSEFLNGTLAILYHITDGPHLPVGQIVFSGHPEISPRLLRREMHRTAPGALFASWRGKSVFTREGFAEDGANLLIYLQDHGYPEGRIGIPKTSVYEKDPSWWVPRPFRKTGKRLLVSVPIEAGPYYRVGSVAVSPALANACGKRCRKLLAFSKAQAGATYSVKSVEDLRHAWVVASQPKHLNDSPPLRGAIEATRTLDLNAHVVRIRIAPSETPPYIVRHIEFHGQHRFSDRYLRRRIGLREGQPFDERGLENGLARLAKTGYFHQIRKDDIRVERNDAAQTADVIIRVSEAGQQRASFSGGQGQFGNTLGLAYSLFDLLQQEELLSARLDGGPDSLQLLFGLVMEGFLGSRSSLAFSIFNNVLRPRFASSVKGPFYTSHEEGLNVSWSYALTQTNTLSLNYGLTRTETDYATSLPPSLTGLPAPTLDALSTSSAVGFIFAHDAGDNRFSIANSVSGDVLGGTENVLRSNEQYARIISDPLFNHQNIWAFRVTFSGAGSYQGEMPFYARLLSSDSQVRGLSPGALGPYALIPATSADGATTYTALPAGANMISAANAEYRVPLGGGVQAAGFFDAGSGWMLPNWLGPTKPLLLESTNGILHGSVGVELHWTIPEIQVPVRAYLAVNVLRLNRFLPLPDGSLFHAHNKLFAFGWALGNLF